MKKIIFDTKLKLFLIVFVLIVLVLIGLILKYSIPKKFSINKYSNNYIKFEYDNSLNLNEKDGIITLETSDNNTSIVIQRLENSSQNEKEVAGSLAYQVVENKGYVETYNEYKDDKYYYLFENYDKGKQIEVVELFKDNYIYVFIYQSNSDEFDLHQESLNIILDSMEVIDK